MTAVQTFRSAFSLLSTLALLTAACKSTPPPSASPSVAIPEAASVRADLEARFADLTPGPAYPGSVWSIDRPVRLAPRAFGAFPQDHQRGALLTIERYRLAASLPSAPTEVDVALVGVYDDAWRSHVAQTLGDVRAWDVVPRLASISSHASIGAMPPLSSGVEDARSLLGRSGLLAPDMEPHPHPPTGRFEFIRRVGGIPVFTNLGVALIGLKDGGAQAVGRRRPILAVTAYPIRSPAEAWSLVAGGKGETMYVDDGAPAGPAQIQEFVATEVELVYLELQVLGPRELLQPYYGFRDAAGSTLYVPAIAFRS
jgi:hypothetical protein